ncbi:CIC11C00000003894 [Sungouiella intermedia]|uniref:CIC11C00000003894 n=1 Tax=Sungouiella intermedia TaxID=45354 RepID=A0A1L0D9S8_9ASCO|nr:CIC11C00000003894 [[Candida] intermedia]
MDEKTEPPFQFIYNYVDQDTFTKYLRLTIIVCIYIFLRGYYSNWSKQRQVKNQIDLDNKLKAEEKKREEQKEEEKLENLDNEAKSFGWGKATRRNVKRQEKICKMLLRRFGTANRLLTMLPRTMTLTICWSDV